jgi:hypothetical protein
MWHRQENRTVQLCIKIFENMLELGYLLLALLIVGLLLIFVKVVNNRISIENIGSNPHIKRGYSMPRLILFFIAWLGYGFALSFFGVFRTYTLPPRIPLLLLLPALIVVFYLFLRGKTEKLEEYLPLEYTVYFQLFRVFVEILFFGTYAKGLIPVTTTFVGYNYEIWFSASALLVGLLVFNLRVLNKKVLIAWNLIGIAFLIVIVGIFITSLARPTMWGASSPQELFSEDFGRMPYMFIPSLYVPAAVFVHILSIRIAIKQTDKKTNYTII